jgi:hypothetical protein
MGGEFYLTCKPDATIDQDKWEQVLRRITSGIKLSHVPERNPETYAFEYVDHGAFWGAGGISKIKVPKSFRIKWIWSSRTPSAVVEYPCIYSTTSAIESNLGGRQRTDWSTVRKFCESLCDNFPGIFALVVSDGFSGYEDDNGTIYYDGIGGRYHQVDYEFWPWTGKMPSLTADTAPHTGEAVISVETRSVDVDHASLLLPRELMAPHLPHAQHCRRSCSYCYVSLEKVLTCGKCSKRPYCSASCQGADWKQHKIWCGHVSEFQVDFEVRESQDKGLGLFALRDFKKGDKILVERPVIVMTVDSSEESSLLLALQVKNQFDVCLPTVQAAIASLSREESTNLEMRAFEDKFGVGPMVYKRNSFGLEPGSGLFVNASRFNHSCMPNCNRYYVHDHKLMVISAGKDIACGDELLISYTREFLKAGFEIFQKHMMGAWGFQCTCHACSDLSVFTKLVQIERSDDKIMQLGSTGKEKEAFRVGQEIIRLCDEVEATPAQYHRTFYDMFQMAVMQKQTLHIAKECAQKSLANWEISIGGSKKEPSEITRARKWVETPQEHRLYLHLDRQSRQFGTGDKFKFRL